MAKPVVVALAFVSLVGCAAVRSTTVPVDEYESYRRFRVAPTIEQKLASSFDYLRKHPRGSYHPEVERWFERAEPRYIEHAWNDAPHLAAFVQAVPEGPEATRASQRLVELELTEKYRARHERAFDEKASRIESRLAVAEAGRRELVGSVAGWARRLAAIRGWGKRRSELDPELIYAYRLADPGARCNPDDCTRTVAVDYSVPEGKVQAAREAIYDVGMRMEKGGVRAAWITGPELFTRLGEAVRVAAISPTDLVGRAEAIGQATQVVASAVEAVLPASRCAAEAVSPVVLHRVCDGVELRVVSAMDLAEEDRIIVEPTGGSSPRGS